MGMKKKLISSILMISILTSYLPVFTNFTIMPESEAAEVQTEWEYNYTGNVQTLVLPYKGIYRIEAYGAKGGTASSRVIGAKGTKVVGTVTLNKNSNLSIYVGGQNGYNGGGAGNSVYGVGGGASDIRLNGTATSNRIIVAGGGGGSTARTNYHSHGGDCYKTGVKEEYKWIGTCQCTTDHANFGGNCGHGNHSSNLCGTPIYEVTLVEYTYVACGKTESTIESYTYLNGNANPVSNGSAYQGSTGGGGGYYGGSTGNAGTSYTNTNFSDVTTTVGAREGNGYVKITLLESYPDVAVTPSTTEFTNQNIILTVTSEDKVVGLKPEPYSWEGGARTANRTYTITKNGTYSVNSINNHDYSDTASITITNIDKIDPVVNSIDQAISNNKKQTTLTIHATDTGNEDYTASGINGYAITRQNTPPAISEFQSSNQFVVNKNGVYYAWAKDKAGNISKLNGDHPSGGTTSPGSSILVKDLEINVYGNITWDDYDNSYQTRKASTMHIYRKIGENGIEEKIADFEVIPGQTTGYSYQTRECNDNGERYIFRIEEDYIEGYDPKYPGNKVTSNETQNVKIDLVNFLLLPTYTSKIEYNLIEDFRGEYLKGTKLEMVATIESDPNNKGHVGVNRSKVAYLIDEGFTIDKNNIQIIYTDGKTGKETIIDDYIMQKNNLWIEYGEGRDNPNPQDNCITKPGDKLTIKIRGEFTKTKAYNNSITLVGYLTDHVGTNTNIDLGQVTRTEKNFEVKYQKPEGRIQIHKKDSITEEALTDAEFTLYEWDGTKYIEKEILKDEDKDGIYTSEYYKWNPTTQGKYKIVETKIPENHKDTAFNMEFAMEELHEDKYTLGPDYNNANHRIAYKEREPDDLDRSYRNCRKRTIQNKSKHQQHR
jgi:hypothetical protein